MKIRPWFEFKSQFYTYLVNWNDIEYGYRYAMIFTEYTKLSTGEKHHRTQLVKFGSNEVLPDSFLQEWGDALANEVTVEASINATDSVRLVWVDLKTLDETTAIFSMYVGDASEPLKVYNDSGLLSLDKPKQNEPTLSV